MGKSTGESENAPGRAGTPRRETRWGVRSRRSAGTERAQGRGRAERGAQSRTRLISSGCWGLQLGNAPSPRPLEGRGTQRRCHFQPRHPRQGEKMPRFLVFFFSPFGYTPERIFSRQAAVSAAALRSVSWSRAPPQALGFLARKRKTLILDSSRSF